MRFRRRPGRVAARRLAAARPRRPGRRGPGALGARGCAGPGRRAGGGGGALPQYRDGLIRTARLEFTRPFAAVAVAANGWAAEPSRWAGLPVFSAWVTAPDEAD